MSTTSVALSAIGLCVVSVVIQIVQARWLLKKGREAAAKASMRIEKRAR